MQSEDFSEGLTAFIEKRPPVVEGPLARAAQVKVGMMPWSWRNSARPVDQVAAPPPRGGHPAHLGGVVAGHGLVVADER